MTRPIAAIVVAIMLLLVGAPVPGVSAHPLDEFSVKTRIMFQPDGVKLKLELAPGILVATLLLEDLDADGDEWISAAEEMAFAQIVAQELTVRLDDQDVALQIVNIEVDPLTDLITGVGTITLVYYVPAEHAAASAREQHTLFYENRFYDGLALYSLHLETDPDGGVVIDAAERDEITQALVEVVYSVDPATAIAKDATDADPPQPAAFWQDLDLTAIPAVDSLIERLRGGILSPGIVLLLFGLAMVAGAFHAFTPGHGKTLVAAFLIANRGTLWHAIALGLLVTLTHSASIYLLGGLVLAATEFFLPGRVIPIIEIAAGILVIGLGIWMLFTRIYGGVADHAHVLPNLAILEHRNMNVLLDGNAADAVDLLITASIRPDVQTAMERAGADNINICSLGCETHDLLPTIKPERLNLATVKHALKTGAVDGMVVSAGKRQTLVNRMAQRMGRSPAMDEPGTLDEAAALLIEATQRFTRRGPVHIPQTELSWRSLASMGLAGGMVPCPDALAILLIALSMGQLLLGLSVVFFFSIGLALTLIAVGLLIVSSGRMFAQSPFLDRLSVITPYAASIFITSIGFWMVARVLGSIS